MGYLDQSFRVLLVDFKISVINAKQECIFSVGRENPFLLLLSHAFHLACVPRPVFSLRYCPNSSGPFKNSPVATCSEAELVEVSTAPRSGQQAGLDPAQGLRYPVGRNELAESSPGHFPGLRASSG